MKIYISGPITGETDYERKFALAAAKIAAAGFEFVNPAIEKLPEGATWADYMRHDLKLLLDCDGVYMMKGWNKSKGAILELELAQKLDMKVFFQEQEEKIK